jgi:hypothetical protein
MSSIMRPPVFISSASLGGILWLPWSLGKLRKGRAVTASGKKSDEVADTRSRLGPLPACVAAHLAAPEMEA